MTHSRVVCSSEECFVTGYVGQGRVHMVSPGNVTSREVDQLTLIPTETLVG